MGKNVLTNFPVNLAFWMSLSTKIRMSSLKDLNKKAQDNNQINYKAMSCQAAGFQKFRRFSMERHSLFHS